MPVPDRIKNAPELYLGLDLFYGGFLDLTTCRQIGMAEGPISWSTIAEYCAYNGISGEQEEDFFYFITKMDSEYLKYQAKKIEANLK